LNYLHLAFLFLSLNACTSAKDMDHKLPGQTSILEAVKNRQYAFVETELKKGTDVNTKDKENKSLLMIATEADDLKMAQLLVSKGADVNQQDHILDSPFLLAGASGQTEFVKLFLLNGARFDVFNRYHGTALIPACERGHVDVVRILSVTKGFPIDHVNRLGWTALMEAVVLGNGGKQHTEVVQILVNAGCNIDIPDKEGITALQHARSRGFENIVKLLESR
jgi:uncharacterized protein